MKRITGLLTAVLILLCSVTASCEEYSGTGNFYGMTDSITYQDIAYLPVDNWSNSAIFSVSALGLMKGSYNNFDPYSFVTASETLAVIFRAAGLEEQCTKMYNSVQAQREANPTLYNTIDKWADGYIRMAVDKKLISIDEFMSTMSIDYPNNSKLFEKDKPITRATLAVWMVKAFGLELTDKEIYIRDFDDYSEIHAQHRAYIETAVKNGIISGDGRNISPYSNVTREQLAQIMYNSAEIWGKTGGLKIISGHIDDVLKDSVKGTDKILDTTKFKVGDEYLIAQREYKMDGEAVDYTHDASLKYVDFHVIRKNYLPADSTSLEKSKNVKAYIKDGKVVLVNILDTLASEEKPNYDDYEDSTVYHGTLYIADTQEQLLIIKDEYGNLIEVPYFSGAEIYNKNTLIDPETLNEKYLDKEIYIFTVKKHEISVDRCYKAQIIE